MYLSFKEEEGTKWDVARCHVPYDGNVNLPYRNYDVSDHTGASAPYYGGLEVDLPLDKYQNWAVNPRGTNSSCPGNFEKCRFQCQIAREFETDDISDVDFVKNGLLTLNAAYHVYDGEISVQSGGAEYIEWQMPMLAMSVKVGLLSLALVLAVL